MRDENELRERIAQALSFFDTREPNYPDADRVLAVVGPEMERLTKSRDGYYNEAADGWGKFRTAERQLATAVKALREVAMACDGATAYPDQAREYARIKAREALASIVQKGGV